MAKPGVVASSLLVEAKQAKRGLHGRRKKRKPFTQPGRTETNSSALSAREPVNLGATGVRGGDRPVAQHSTPSQQRAVQQSEDQIAALPGLSGGLRLPCRHNRSQ